MATNAAIGHGSVFYIGIPGSPIVYNPLSEVVSITPPQIVRDVVDATHMSSFEKWREFIPGLRDAGEMTLELNFHPGGTDEQELFNKFVSDLPIPYKIEFPNGHAWLFEAYITGVETEVPLDDKMMLTATFKITGAPEFVTNP